ncbi:MAG: flagellar hook protein FlgE [Pseudomonadota bacterium]
MSLYASLFSGVSGLSSYSSALGAISDNITNVNTVGYKNTETAFTTLVTETSATAYSPGGVQAVPRTLVSRQGLLQASTSNTDLAVDGAGFFVVKNVPEPGDLGEQSFTRAGSFRPDDEGFLQNTAGLYLMGWELDSTGDFNNDGDLGSLVPINTGDLTGTAEATTSVALRANLQSSQEINPLEATYAPNVSANNMASGTIDPDFERNIQVFDAQGGTHSLNFSVLRTAVPNEWHVEIYADPASDVITAPGFVDGQVATGILRFNADGSLDQLGSTPALFDPVNIAWTNGTGVSEITFDLGSDGAVDGVTQFDSTSTLISSVIDGAVFGNVTGVNINTDGVVTALFDNGLTRDVYRLPLATFQNPDGLTRLQNNAFGVSDFSGSFSLVEPTTGGGGSISPSTLEASTVDLAQEFTQLITVQRAFSASTRIITTADEMLNELNQIRR